MEDQFQNHSNGAQKFDYLFDKVRRSVIFIEKEEHDLAVLRDSVSELRVQRNSLLNDTSLLKGRCEAIAGENDIQHTKASVLIEHIDDFLANCSRV